MKKLHFEEESLSKKQECSALTSNLEGTALNCVMAKTANERDCAFDILLNRFGSGVQEHQATVKFGECIRQIHTHLRRKFVPCSRALGAFRVWGSFFLDFRNFSIRGCLELLSRTARAIAGHLKEDLGGCIRQIDTHLRRLCPGLRSFGSFRLREVFFFKTKFY